MAILKRVLRLLQLAIGSWRLNAGWEVFCFPRVVEGVPGGESGTRWVLDKLLRKWPRRNADRSLPSQ